MDKNDILKFCYGNNLYNSLGRTILNCNLYGLPYSIGFLGQFPKNLKKFAINFLDFESYNLYNAFNPNIYADIKYSNSNVTIEGETEYKGIAYQPESYYYFKNINIQGDYWVGCFKQYQQYKKNDDYYYNWEPLKPLSTQCIYFIETKNQNTFSNYNKDSFSTYTDTVEFLDGQSLTRTFTYPIKEDSTDENFKGLAIIDFNIMRKIENPWVLPTELPIKLWGEQYIPNYFPSDPNELEVTDVNNTSYYIFMNLIKNTISFGCEYTNQDSDFIWVDGPINYPAPVILKNCQIRLGAGTSITNTENRSYFWEVEPVWEDSTSTNAVATWLKKIPI